MSLKSSKPKHSRYPTEILNVGDELRKARIDRGLTQQEVSRMLGANTRFVYDIECGRYHNSIHALHKVYTFLGYVPITLRIDENTIQGKLFGHRIKEGLSIKTVSEKIGLNHVTIRKFEKGRPCTVYAIEKIKTYVSP